MNKTKFVNKLVKLGIRKKDIQTTNHGGYGITATITGRVAPEVFDYQINKPRQIINNTVCYYDGEKIEIGAYDYESAYNFVIDYEEEIKKKWAEIELIEEELSELIDKQSAFEEQVWQQKLCDKINEFEENKHARY